MDRQQFIIATAVTLFIAFLAGWLACWLIGRLTRGGGGADGALAAQLRDAEAARDTATAETKRLEADLSSATAELAESRAEIEELRAYIDQRLARNRGAPT